jgi:hypothetical protein
MLIYIAIAFVIGILTCLGVLIVLVRINENREYQKIMNSIHDDDPSKYGYK